MFSFPRTLISLAALASLLQALNSPPIFLPRNPSLPKRQDQVQLPPNNGPCLQDRGAAPLDCSDPACVDVPLQGLCHIQTQQGFPICGCCSNEEIACSSCGGDAGNGLCKGTGRTGLQFQGCSCSNTGGEEPTDQDGKVCAEDNGQPTLSCDDPNCGGEIPVIKGMCLKQTPINGGPFYRHCACCPPNTKIGCDACGGDAGGGKCTGLPDYRGMKYQGCGCDANGGGDIPPPIIPFPVPPPGFPPPGEDTPRPKKKCQDGVFEKCQSCNGSGGYCKSGDKAGCPCKNDCSAQQQSKEPNCDDETCKGENGQCTTGPNEKCKCKQSNCPAPADTPDCVDPICGGPSNSSWFSGCKGGQNSANKDCLCFNIPPNPPPYNPFTDAQNILQQAILSDLADLTAPPPTGPDPNRPHPASTPGCASNTAKSIIDFVILGDGSNTTTHNLFYTMRETLCNNKCELPPNIPADAARATPYNTDNGGCEIAISVAGSKEVYARRDTPSQGPQWQDCWDSLANITETCINNGPNSGWVNGPDDFEFFQAGVRNLGSPDKKYSGSINGGLSYSAVYCETCGGDTKNGGKCTTGMYNGHICCPSGTIACDDSRCNADGSLCTGAWNGCICVFNGFRG